MKNQIYNRHGVYEIIRNHYIKNFPYPILFQALNAINESLYNINKNASLKKDGDQYKFINPNSNKENNSPYGNPGDNLFAYLSQSSGVEALLQDINALQEWLSNNGFIFNGIATEKMLVTSKL